jgi:agmatine deiminase
MQDEDSPLFMPAEWEPHERTLICWPARDEIWRTERGRAVEDHAQVVAATARFEPVTVIAHPRRSEEAEQAISAAGPHRHEVDVVALPIDDSWARDTGPWYVRGADHGLRVLDPTFTGWGGKCSPIEDDVALPRRWAERTGVPLVDEAMVLEGGAVTVDGAGTLVTTEQCLLHPNRNPDMTRTAIEDTLRRRLGATTVVWLPFGLVLDDDTDGHVDNVAAFVGPGHLLVQGCDDPDEVDHVRLTINRRCATDAPDATGRPIRTTEVPVLPFVELAGERLAVPYLNLYLCNGGALVPTCGHAADDEMLGIIAEALPGREVVPVPGSTLALGGGGPHCITQQVPVGNEPLGGGR